jgi:hypothetical protein
MSGWWAILREFELERALSEWAVTRSEPEIFFPLIDECIGDLSLSENSGRTNWISRNIEVVQLTKSGTTS